MLDSYKEDFQLLSRAEMRVILLKIYTPRPDVPRLLVWTRGARQKITMTDVARETKISQCCLLYIKKGLPNTQNPPANNRKLSAKKHVVLSRFLLKYECGMVKKEDGVMIYLDQPTKSIAVIRQVLMGASGPFVKTFEARQAPTAMPKFKEIFNREPLLPLPRQK